MDIIIYTLVLAHISMMCTTVYIHRGIAHRGLEFHPVLSHILRFLIFVLDGADVRGWSTTHRIHHRYTEQHGDPHSPYIQGVKEVFWDNFVHTMYRRYKNKWEPEWVRVYGSGAPEDWIERNIYRPYHQYGIFILLALNLYLWGWWGILSWFVIIAWTPFFSNTFVNGVGHWCGYRNYKTKDKTKNFSPIGLLICGEEMHNNHHGEPANPKFSRKWFEFDIGWMYIKIFESLRLLKVVERSN